VIGTPMASVQCRHHPDQRVRQVLWRAEFGQDAWQFPQGGIQRNETPEQALYRGSCTE